MHFNLFVYLNSRRVGRRRRRRQMIISLHFVLYSYHFSVSLVFYIEYFITLFKIGVTKCKYFVSGLRSSNLWWSVLL